MSATASTSSPPKRDRLVFRLFRFVEGEAEGRFAIAALVFLMVAAVVASFTLNSLMSEATCRAAIACDVARPAVARADPEAIAPSIPTASPGLPARRHNKGRSRPPRTRPLVVASQAGDSPATFAPCQTRSPARIRTKPMR